MASNLFQLPRLRLMTGDGRLELTELPASRINRAALILSRERCHFDSFEHGATLDKRQAIAAARLRAENSGPFLNNGYLITRKGDQFGIWWWDSDWVAEKLLAADESADVAVFPEPIFYDAAEGARILALSSGYEAQLWQDGFLIADLWRRRKFTEDSWADFLRTAPPLLDRDKALPSVQHLVLQPSSSYRRTVVSSWSQERVLTFAILTAAVMLICISAFLFGNGLNLNQQATRTSAEIASIRRAAPVKVVNKKEMESITTFQEDTSGPDPLTLLACAQRILTPFGFKIETFTADRHVISIDLPEEAVSGVDLLASELVHSSCFSAVEPKLDHASKKLELRLIVRRAKGQKVVAQPIGGGVARLTDQPSFSP
jgi:hypothetical protein